MALPAAALERPAAVSLPRTSALVGAGRAGTSVAAALARAGIRPLAHTADADRTVASQRRAVALLPGVPAFSPVEAARSADLVLLAVPDDQLPGVVADLAGAGAVGDGQIVVHLSGAYGLAVLAPLAALGAVPLALHPVQTFAGTAEDLPRLAAAAVGVTARDQDQPLARALVEALGATPVLVPEHARAAYHAALCHGANHLVTLVADAAGALRASGVDEPERLLRPLLAAALERALTEGIDGLTGPVRRGDAGTVAAHLAALDGSTSGAVAPYAALARRTAELAVEAGVLDADGARRICAALDEAAP